MRNIKLLRETAKNFKGIKETEIIFQFPRTNISGPNASNKTTLVDAFDWLLFDRDSLGNSNFQARPTDATGADINFVDIEVSATMAVDDEEITFTKTQKQKWVKKRGSETQTFEGNVNEYQINGFPAKKAEYDAKIREIIGEELFRLLTDPRAFASIKWQDQRKILLQFVSEITDESILDTDSKYDPIRADVLAAGADKAREKAQATLKMLKKEQAEYPIRIDEATSSLVEVADREDIAQRRAGVEAAMRVIQNERDSLTTSLQSVSNIRNEIVQANMRLMEIENTAKTEHQRNLYLLKGTCEEKKHIITALQTELDKNIQRCNGVQEVIEANESDIVRLRAQWKETKARSMPEDEEYCPTCGQKFPEKNLTEIARQFQERKAKDLATISDKGKELRADVDKAKELVENLTVIRKKLEGQILDAQTARDKAQEEVNNYVEADFHEDPEYIELKKKVEDLSKQLEQMDTGTTAKQVLAAREIEQRDILTSISKEEAALEANERTKARIQELKDGLMDCSQKVADQEQVVFLLEEFTRVKMNMLSEKINGKFSRVRFKLFEMQVNGGMRETCVMQINSNGSYVDYGSANNAAKIIGGLDVIDALSELYGVTAPIWLDNAEAINDVNIPETKAQMILLRVSDKPGLSIE